ncbi:MAG: hypothetical protein CVV39_03525 [Planctomycetes bacterium HGW-Planctomycetes-1]|nr:MAG: hypothetical protein CVV39_03525 [Planctomycetes bacterium HGW-Planctomycetes-1]
MGAGFMKANDRENNGNKGALEDYITIAIAEDIDLANEYRDILARHNIPAVTATQRSYSSDVLGTAVMVPEHFLEQAQEIIESQQDFDHFLDDAFNDPDSWNNEPDFDEYDERDNFYDDDNI